MREKFDDKELGLQRLALLDVETLVIAVQCTFGQGAACELTLGRGSSMSSFLRNSLKGVDCMLGEGMVFDLRYSTLKFGKLRPCLDLPS
jgi:hypothetical protein